MEESISKGSVRMMEKRDFSFEAFKKLVPYLRGALWWAQNDLIKDRHREFNQDDKRKGHPLLSVSKREVEGRFDVVPMLVGTSGVKMSIADRSRCVVVRGMTRTDPGHKTYFGSIVQPGMYAFEDLMSGVRPERYTRHSSYGGAVKRRDDERGRIMKEKDKWYYSRTMIPNWHKPMVSDNEMRELNRFCGEREGL